MKLFRLGIVLLGLFWISESQGQQIPQFSQYMFNPVFINPAYAGYKQQLYINSYYRKQWTSMNGSPETFAFSADTYLPESKLGIGGQIISDKLGAVRTTAAFGNISYHLQLSENRYLNFGAGIGLVNSMLDGGMLIPKDDLDPNIPAIKNQVLYPDLKLGVFFYDEFFYLGLAGDQIISTVFNPDHGDVIMSPVMHFYLTWGSLIDLNYNFSLLPSFMYMDDLKAPARLDLNTSLVIVDRFWIGAGYRFRIDMPGRDIQPGLKKSASILGMLQAYLGEDLRLGYAYDHNLSGISVNNIPTHEISISYLLPPKRIKMISPRFF